MNKKNTKRNALFTSVISLLLCFSMLLGTTFAWFTDEVTSGGNVITAGTLKIDLLHLVEGDWVSLKENPDHKVFNYDLWEPGYTQVETLKIANLGNLAFQYQMNVTAEEGTPVLGPNGENLADVIDVYMCFGEANAASFDDIANGTSWWKMGTLAELMASPEGITQGKMLPAGATYEGELLGQNGVMIGECTASIALHMQESAGNEYQGLSVGDLYINLAATQYTFEKDSFDDQYDKNATFEQLADPSIQASETKTLAEGADSIEFAVSTNGFNLAQVTVPASAIADPTQPVTVSFDGMNPADTIELGANTKAYAFDIKVSNLKEDLADDQLVTVVVTAPYALPMMKAYHNGEEIAATYDELAGTITFKTANFSPFAFSYTEMTVSNLDELRAAVVKNNVLIKLGDNLTVDLGTNEGAVYEAQNTGGDGYYYTKAYKNGVIVSGQNVAVDLNGYTITVTCDTNKLGDAGALFFVDPEVEGSSLNIIDQSSAQTGTIVMSASAYMVWANEDADGEDDTTDKTTSYDVDIFSGKFVSDKYAGDPVAPGGATYAENSNCAIVYAGNGGTINVYGGYFLYDSTPDATTNRNNGGFNVMTHVTMPCITIHDGVMLSNQYYRQENGTDDDSINLAGYCEIVETNDISVTIDGKTYSNWYRVTSYQPVSLTVEGLQESYAVGDTLNLTVKANYSYGSKVVTNYTVSGFDNTKTGYQTVTVSYEENDKAVSSEFVVMVEGTTRITVETVNDFHQLGTPVEKEDLLVKAYTTNGKMMVLTNFTITNTVDTSTVGIKTVDVSFAADDGVVLTASADITVLDMSVLTINRTDYAYDGKYHRMHFFEPSNFSVSGWANIVTNNNDNNYASYVGKTYEAPYGESVKGFNNEYDSNTSTTVRAPWDKGFLGYEWFIGENQYDLTIDNALPYTKLGINCNIGYDEPIIGFGYYINGDPLTLKAGNANWVPIDPEQFRSVYGEYGATAFYEITLSDFKPGETYTVHWVAVFDDGIQNISEWTVNMKPASTNDEMFVDTDKSDVNVIIMAGQSNMYGVTPLTQDMKNQYGHETVDYSNVFIHYKNLQLDLNDNLNPYTVSSNTGFEMYRPGIGGAESYYYGPEFGLAYWLADTTDETWYIIKYGASGTALGGHWNTPYSVDGGAPTTLTDDMINYVQAAIDELSADYDVNVRSFMWMQGESDATDATLSNNYANAEKALVERVRNEFAGYATRSASAPTTAGSGIIYINSGIAANNGSNGWTYSDTVNNAKIANSEYLFSIKADEETFRTEAGPLVGYEFKDANGNFALSIKNPNASGVIANSIYVDTYHFTTKAQDTANHGQYLLESDKSDVWHYGVDSMFELGYLYTASLIYVMSLNG